MAQRAKSRAKFHLNPPRKKFTSGHYCFYLGKKYRLKLIRGEKNQIEVKKRIIVLTHKNKITTKRAHAILDAWYFSQAKLVFESLLTKCWKVFSYRGAPKPKMLVRRMQTCWGVFSSHGHVITINRDLIKVHKACIIYVIFHELCHLKSMYHDEKFHTCLDAELPNWRRARALLDKWVY